MNNDHDRNYVSVGSWMGMMFVTAIPILGWVMILIWAFAGENESRKNYYRAILAWLLILVLLFVGLVVFTTAAGSWPAIQKRLHLG